ncbi:MAG TPA: RNA methyltransferase, partial [Ruminococcaceae bacterium]|nr:RNA methyltransferase [Oscillospiraceae bacterium]
MHELISSKTNEKIKTAVRIRDSAKARREEGLFFAEGARLCTDAANSTQVKYLFFTETASKKYNEEIYFLEAKCEEAFQISGGAAEKLSDTFSPQGIFCVCKTLDKKYNIDIIYNKHKLIALENIQDR